MAEGVFTPYSTIAPFTAVKPTWVSAADQERIASYQAYEEIYWNHPETFKLVLRGTEGRPLYIPAGRVIVDTVNRYTAPKLDWLFQSENPQQALEAEASFRALFARERFRSKFNSGKRFGLIRGDFVLHVIGDDTKPQGRRLSIKTVDPASYFPVYSDTDPDSLVKVHLAEQFTDSGGKVLVRRQTYEYTDAGILNSETIWEPDKWFIEGGDAAPVQVVKPPTALPAQVTVIPVYHFANQYEDGNPFGSSEMRGLERVMSGINQGITDEDLALALEGLGLYTTESGPPTDPETGEETDWVLGPGRVVEDPTGSFKRVQGIGSVSPFLNHLDWLLERLYEVGGTDSAARGQVDVQVAESGVALALRLAPILAKGQEKTDDLSDVLTQMVFDLRTMWMPVYEGLNYDATNVVPVFGNPLPTNVKAEIEQAVLMVTNKIMSAATARENLARIGVTFSPDEFARITQEAQAEADLTAGSLGLGASGAGDTFNARVDGELSGSASA